MAEPPHEKPELAIGIVTDCQYADVDTPPNSRRRYRLSRQKLGEAVDYFNGMEDLSFVLHLGDMIDRDVHSYQNVVPVYRRLKMPHYQVIGNHDYTIDDAAKAGVPGLLEMEHRYYSVTAGRWRFVILDGNEVSLFSHAKTSLETAAAAQYARTSTRKLTEWSGGIGQDQLAWLRVQLDQARRESKAVVLCCHYPVLPIGPHALWNAEEVLQLLREFPGNIAAWFNGHNHDGDYTGRHGIHFLNYRGMVETETNCFARVEFFPDRIRVIGSGREPSRDLRLPAPDAAPESLKPKPRPGRAATAHGSAPHSP